MIVVEQKGNKEVDSEIDITSHTLTDILLIRHSKTLKALHQNQLVKHQKNLTKLYRQG